MVTALWIRELLRIEDVQRNDLSALHHAKEFSRYIREEFDVNNEASWIVANRKWRAAIMARDVGKRS